MNSRVPSSGSMAQKRSQQGGVPSASHNSSATQGPGFGGMTSSQPAARSSCSAEAPTSFIVRAVINTFQDMPRSVGGCGSSASARRERRSPDRRRARTSAGPSPGGAGFPPSGSGAAPFDFACALGPGTCRSVVVVGQPSRLPARASRPRLILGRDAPAGRRDACPTTVPLMERTS